jgi:transcriptional regulator GlxA family with amidase domain
MSDTSWRNPHGDDHDIVVRAERLMWEHVDEPLSLGVVAAAVHCSERTLFARFRNRHGTGPLRYFRIQRLQAAHRAIVGDDGRTIGEIAFALGFNHLGRFCRDYVDLFGVTPSGTRRALGQRASPSAAARRRWSR